MLAKAMFRFQLHQTDRCHAGWRLRALGALAAQAADVAQHLAACAGALQPLPHRRIVPRQARHEVLDGAALEPRGHEALDPDIGELELEAHLAAEDDELAGDVHAREVIAWVGLRVASLARVADDLGERRTRRHRC